MWDLDYETLCYCIVLTTLVVVGTVLHKIEVPNRAFVLFVQFYITHILLADAGDTVEPASALPERVLPALVPFKPGREASLVSNLSDADNPVLADVSWLVARSLHRDALDTHASSRAG